MYTALIKVVFRKNKCNVGLWSPSIRSPTSGPGLPATPSAEGYRRGLFPTMTPPWLPAVGFTILPSIGSTIGQIGTDEQMKTWFVTLRKPRWAPPNWVFPPVWTTLNTSVGYGSYLIWKELGGFTKDAVVPLGVYATYLALAWSWSQVFFGAHKLKLAFFHSVLMTGCAAATVVVWCPINRTASYLMAPTVPWLVIETVWSYRFWKDNLDKTK
ncbi:translocator protein-like isoform X1 [Ranitomeya variabilis]|uniref:translocator protein-like isoform X1 n=2 Tax=Ranitomeya variabilis TaxID=490064 RepID=UPI004057668B